MTDVYIFLILLLAVFCSFSFEFFQLLNLLGTFPEYSKSDEFRLCRYPIAREQLLVDCCCKNASVESLRTTGLLPESERGLQCILKLPGYVLDCLSLPEIYHVRSYNVFALCNVRIFDEFVEVSKVFLSSLSLFIDQKLKTMEIESTVTPLYRGRQTYLCKAMYSGFKYFCMCAGPYTLKFSVPRLPMH